MHNQKTLSTYLYLLYVRQEKPIVTCICYMLDKKNQSLYLTQDDTKPKRII